MFLCAGMVIANLYAYALEELAEIAGTASAIVGATTTTLCIMIAAPIGLAFNGTGLPLIYGVATCATLGFIANFWNAR